MTGFSAKVARQAFERDGEACFRCRKPLLWHTRGIGFSIHHRKPRGMGGSADPVVNSIASALTLCGSGVTGCHGWVERFRASAREDGYLVPLNGIDTPAGTRIRRQDGTFWLLTSSGLAVEVDEGMGR